MRSGLLGFLTLMCLLVAGCGDDSEESCHPMPVSGAADDGEACTRLCEGNGFESSEERQSGCFVECECSGGSGTLESVDDCYFYCDSWDIVEDERMMFETNTCICDRTE